MFREKNRNSSEGCEICSKLTIETLEQRQRLGSINLPLGWYWKKVRVSDPADIHLLKVNNGNTRTIYEIYSNVTTKTPGRHHRRLSGIFIVTFQEISHIVLVFPLLPLNKKMLAGELFPQKLAVYTALKKCVSLDYSLSDIPKKCVYSWSFVYSTKPN